MDLTLLRCAAARTVTKSPKKVSRVTIRAAFWAGSAAGNKSLLIWRWKPTSSITVPGRTINRFGEEVEMITKGRHDPCVGIRAVPIAEAMLAIVLMDHLLRQRAQNADVKTDIPRW